MIGFAPNFTFKELTSTNTGLPNKPRPDDVKRLRYLSYRLQNIRDAVGKPLYINSAFRSDAVNRAVGGVRNSFHLLGCAADVSIRNLSTKELVIFEKAIIDSEPIEFIKYDTFYHIAYDPMRSGMFTPVTKPSKQQFDL